MPGGFRFLAAVGILLLGGCGRPGPMLARASAASIACSGNSNGVWAGPAGARVTLDPGCAVQFESQPACRSVGTYTAMMGTTGYTTIEIQSREGSPLACPAPGRFQCSFVAAGGLTLNCGAGAVAYFKVFK